MGSGAFYKGFEQEFLFHCEHVFLTKLKNNDLQKQKMRYVLFLLVLLFICLSGCAEKEETIDNIYTSRIVISKEELIEGIKKINPHVQKTEFVEIDGKVYMDLGDLHQGFVTDNQEGRFLERYFAYNPNDDFYGIRYHKPGVYGGTFERRSLEYYPHKLTLVRARAGGRIAYNETWTCMTYQDILDWATTERIETDCYSYTQ